MQPFLAQGLARLASSLAVCAVVWDDKVTYAYEEAAGTIQCWGRCHGDKMRMTFCSSTLASSASTRNPIFRVWLAG